MASGENVLAACNVIPPPTSYAQPILVVGTGTGGSQPAENVIAFSFDDTAVEYMDFECRLGSNYAGGGLTLLIPFSSASATSGAAVMQAAIRRLQIGTTDFDTGAFTYAYQSDTQTVPGTAGVLTEAEISFANGSEMNSLAAGEPFIMRVRRNAGDGGDTLTGDALVRFYQMALRET